MEKITDYIVPILGLGLAIISVRKTVLEGWKTLAALELIISILIMGVYIIIALQSSKTNETLQINVIRLLEARKTDSTNNADFQKYLKDSLGVARDGNKARIVNQFIYNSNVHNETIVQNLKDNSLPDSINYIFRVVKDSLYISPKEGAWQRAYFSFDTANDKKNASLDNSSKYIVSEGLGPTEPDKIFINNKMYVVYTNLINDRAVYNKKPIALNLAGNRNQYIVFGEQGNATKRYFYKQGRVTWIPEK